MSQAVGWSVTLVAHRRELVLVIQTDGALSELVLWDDLTLLGSTILRVTWKGSEEENKVFVLSYFCLQLLSASTGNMYCLFNA